MIRVRTDDGVRIVTLDRADKRNAMTPEMFTHLRRAVGEVGDARAVVLGGEGNVFCGGFDLRMCLDAPGTLRTLLVELSAVIGELRLLDIPVVIAAHGAAIAGGCALLGAADYVVINDDAKLGYPVVKLGVSPAVSGAFLRRLVGDGRCRERLLDTDLVSGKEAVRIGLASESLTLPEQVLPRAIEVARQLAARPGIGVRETKRWLREIEDDDARARGFRDAADEAERALRASLSIEGRDEERAGLAAMFAPRTPGPQR
jgi:enoyl-CoA hydratase/carnithine racemase